MRLQGVIRAPSPDGTRSEVRVMQASSPSVTFAPTAGSKCLIGRFGLLELGDDVLAEQLD